MKKIVLMVSVFVVAMTGRLMAQADLNGDGRPDLPVANSSSILTCKATSNNGPQTVQISGGKGTLMFDKQGDKFSNVRFIDEKGKLHQFSKAAFPSIGPLKAGETPFSDACFATADKRIELCFCKLTNTIGNNAQASGVMAKIRKWGATQSDAVK